MRAMVSVGPPAAKGTVMVIVRVGYGCANVLEPVSDNTQATTRNSNFLDDIFASPSQAETQGPRRRCIPRVQETASYRLKRMPDRGNAAAFTALPFGGAATRQRI